MVETIFTESADQVMQWKAQVLELAGLNGRMLVDVIPALEQLIGPQPAVAEIGPAEAQSRNFFSLDATCPLVTKVHREAAIHFKRGREILLIGHSHHPEVVGTLGQLPSGAITLVQSVEEVMSFTPRDAGNLAYASRAARPV